MKIFSPRLRRDLLEIVHAGIQSADAAELVTSALGHERSWADAPVDLVAAGKAATAMAGAALDVLGDRIRRGVVTAAAPVGSEPGRSRQATGPWMDRLEWIAASHPLPDAGSVTAGRRALELAADSNGRAGLLVLLSGGASSMLVAPAAGVTLAEKVDMSRMLLGAGAEIHAFNAVRKHLSELKGGRLATTAGRLRTYAVSDVVAPVADDPSVIGSGPTVADPTTFADAIQVVEEYGLRSRAPLAVMAALEAGRRGERAESPKPGDPRLAEAEMAVVGNRQDAMQGAARAAARLGYLVVTHHEPVIGEARLAARSMAENLARLAARVDRPLCVLSSGETTVRVAGDGRGGRNQEFALALVRPLASFEGQAAVASVGTDGVDGPTDAAGAFVDTTTLDRATTAGLADPESYLERNDSNRYFAAIGDLVITGPTSTNVGDLQVGLVDGR